jgi:hypothetical protein
MSTDTRNSHTYKHHKIDPVGVFGPMGETFGAVSNPRYFPHKGRVQFRWWRVTSPDGKWVDCATLADARNIINNPVGSMA